MLGNRLVGALFGLVGIALLVGGGFFVQHKVNFIQSAERASGVVTALIPERGSKGSTIYAPQIKYTTKDGQVTTFDSSIASNPPSYDVGDSVSVLYSPKNVYKAEIDSFWSLWLAAIILLFMGTIFTFFGFAMLRARAIPSDSANPDYLEDPTENDPDPEPTGGNNLISEG